MTIAQQNVGVLGGIQPDRLRSVLLKAEENAPLARAGPVWPEPAFTRHPAVEGNEALIDTVLAWLSSRTIPRGTDGAPDPSHIFTVDGACDLLDHWRRAVRWLGAGPSGRPCRS